MTMRHLFALIFVCSSLASVVASSTQGRKERRYLRRKLEDPEFQLRIIGGDNADEDRYPYYVALMRKGGSFICGGTLIASDVVLTAAHCFAKDLESVLVGKYARGDSNTDPLEERAIDQTYIHPDFHYDKRRFDQMLITLKSPSTYPYLKHINLDESVPAVGGSDITTIGLGVTSLGGNRPDVLQEVTNNYVPNDKCAKERSNQIDYADVIRFDHLCVEGQNNAGGQCYGDSGGPQLLLGATADDDIQVGVVSWGVDCGTEKFPSVGSRTSASTFIKDKTCELSSDPPSILCTDRPLPDTPTPSTISPTSGPTVGPAVGPTVGPTVDERTIVVPLGGGADLDLTANETAVPTDEVTDDMMADP